MIIRSDPESRFGWFVIAKGSGDSSDRHHRPPLGVHGKQAASPTNPHFGLPTAVGIATLSAVKKVLGICLLLLPIFCAHGQDQERKLIDRIMKPNMTLENEAQSKKFVADRTSVHKKAHVGTFNFQQKSPAKNYRGTRNFSSQQFNSQEFAQTDHAVANNVAGKKASSSTYAEASKTKPTRTAHDQDRGQASRDYAGNRPYLEQGKSQKSLNRKNKPMTIDEVRELLNKNK